ncbi:hypothetical protein PIB30_044497 [Stylosanthes scabra]|uniref:Uncharacterized protein n=1 Tax=Stylosanthes scabra TaxID=79078 RepID=A0ABU6YEP6_9FABA|nr:hypothetical protein [Stylosanthes scabra]
MRRIRGYSSIGPSLTGLRTAMYVCVSSLHDTGGRIHSRLRYLAGREQEIVDFCLHPYLLWTIEWHQVDRVIPQFGGVQNYPHRPLNIDWLHAQDGRGGDRFLAPDDAFYPRPPDEIPFEAIQRVTDTPAGGTQVDDVFDNRRPGRRRMIGTRTTDRDWRWLNEMIGDEVAAPRRVRRMPEDGGRRGGRVGRTGGGEARSLHLSLWWSEQLSSGWA